MISQNTNTNHNWSRSRRLDTHLVSVSIILHDEISSEDYSTESTFTPWQRYFTRATYNQKINNSDLFQNKSQDIKNDLSDTIRKIESLREIEDGWAGEDSVSPTNAAIGDAITFIASLPHGLPTPSVTPASDGEIIIEWLFEAKKTVLGFEGDGSFSYAMFINGKYRPGAEEGSVLKGQIPADLLDYLKKMEQ